MIVLTCMYLIMMCNCDRGEDEFINIGSPSSGASKKAFGGLFGSKKEKY